MIKVFFGRSLRGGYDVISHDKLSKIMSIVENCGCEIVAKYSLDPDIIRKQNKYDAREIHDTDYTHMLNSDIGIFEISNPSLGVGAQISDMIHLKKPILCIYKHDLYNIISRSILGKEESKFFKGTIKIFPYKSDDDIKLIVKNFLSALPRDTKI